MSIYTRTHLNTIAKPTPLFSVCNLQAANCNPHTGIETGIVTHLHEICKSVNLSISLERALICQAKAITLLDRFHLNLWNWLGIL